MTDMSMIGRGGYALRNVQSITRGLRLALPAAGVALLIACGGGGGSRGSTNDIVGPPTTAAALTNSSAEAAQSAEAVAGGADKMAGRASSLSPLSALFGEPLLAPQSVSGGGDGRRHVLSASRKRPLAVETVPCIDLLDPPCSGSATIDTNIADEATIAARGDFADIRFTALSGLVLGNDLVVNGRMRLEFLSPFDIEASTFDGLDLKLQLDALSGSLNGAAFGPLTDTGRLQIDAQGVSTVTADGVSYTGLNGVAVTGPDDYRISAGKVRLAYWSDSERYVDMTLQDWQIVNGRPVVGSRATVAAGADTLSIRVTASSSNTVVYAVNATVGGVTSSYTVTATYPTGGGAPTYAAAPI